MNILKPIILLLSFLYITGCATVGPTLIIETPEPAEDFVVICKWGTTFNQAGTFDEDVHVIKSGEKLSCGFNILGRASASMQHPIYTGWHSTIVDDVRIVKVKTKLQRLDEIKTQFESGFWDEFNNPGYQYASSVGNCGLGFSYLDKYSTVKQVDKAHFKKLYNEPIEKCLTRVIKIYKKYQPRSSKSFTDGKTRMKKFWDSERWKKYE